MRPLVQEDATLQRLLEALEGQCLLIISDISLVKYSITSSVNQYVINVNVQILSILYNFNGCINSRNTCIITTETIINIDYIFLNCSSSVRIFIRLISNLICIIYPQTLRHAGVCNVYAVLVNSPD